MYTKGFSVYDAFHMAGSPETEKPIPGVVYRHEDKMSGMFPRSYTISFNTSGPYVKAEITTTREGIESLRDALDAALNAEDTE